MGFLSRNKATVVLTAALVLIAGGAFVSGQFCGSNCCLTSLFGTSVAQAGPECSADSKTGATCSQTGTACTKSTTATAASATGGGGCCSKAKTTEASATGCAGMIQVNATAASVDGKACPAENKEACIAKCMAEKGMTRAEAEKCWETCQTSATASVQTASATDGKACSKSCSATCEKSCGVHVMTTEASVSGEKHLHSRQACIDACIARGMSRADAEAAADKCGTAGNHLASVETTEGAASGSLK